MLAALIGEDHAWKTSQCDTLEEFITSLEQFKIIKSESVGKAMRQVDRANYVRDADDAYEDSPQPIGYEATISAPHMHAWCLELFSDMMKEDMSVLDVGSGSGYLTACMAAMLKDQFPDHPGKVIGIDIIPELVLYAQKNTQAANPDLMAPKGSVAYQLANGWEGAPDHAPYDFIHVGAAAESLPQTLVDQLKVGGRMVIPMNDSPHGRSQGLYLVEKTSKDGPPTTEYLMGVRYVPLVKKL
jgi:protein-L-isoaspartate(D-aspartate) O-methyltransferase